MHMGPWKRHFSTTEDYYGSIVGRSELLVFSIRMDSFESYDNSDSYGHLNQKGPWQTGPVGELMKEHLTTLAKYPRVQSGKSFDMSDVVEQFMSKGRTDTSSLVPGRVLQPAPGATHCPDVLPQLLTTMVTKTLEQAAAGARSRTRTR
jgi:hypothetical protein